MSGDGRALLLGHGSPDPGARLELGELRALVTQRLARRVGLGVLEFPAPGLPGLDEAFSALPPGGAIAAQPLILFDGLHGQHDMPAIASRAAARLSALVRLGQPFGRDPRLVGMMAGRLLDQRPGQGDVLLFAGRGSSEERAVGEMEEVAEALGRQTGLDPVVCYTGISRPTLEEGMRKALERRPRRVLALPYLLHTGVLVRRVREVVVPIAEGAGSEVVVLPHIGNAPVLVEVVASRVQELLERPERLPAGLGASS